MFFIPGRLATSSHPVNSMDSPRNALKIYTAPRNLFRTKFKPMPIMICTKNDFDLSKLIAKPPELFGQLRPLIGTSGGHKFMSHQQRIHLRYHQYCLQKQHPKPLRVYLHLQDARNYFFPLLRPTPTILSVLQGRHSKPTRPLGFPDFSSSPQHDRTLLLRYVLRLGSTRVGR